MADAGSCCLCAWRAGLLCAVGARLFPGNGPSLIKFCPQTCNFYLPSIFSLSPLPAIATSFPLLASELALALLPKPRGSQLWWCRPHLCTWAALASFPAAQPPFSPTQAAWQGCSWCSCPPGGAVAQRMGTRGPAELSLRPLLHLGLRLPSPNSGLECSTAPEPAGPSFSLDDTGP